MKNSTNLTREQNLHNWSQIVMECQEAKSSGTKVKDWLDAHGISKDTYYYWYNEIKNRIADGEPAIVPVSSDVISYPSTIISDINPVSAPAHSVSCIKLTINDVTIEINDLTNPDTLKNVIKAVRCA